MNILLEGILLGLVLSVSTGPIFFAIVQSSLKQGLMAGILVGSGVWISDILFILGTYAGISRLQSLQENEAFNIGFGIVGGLVLFAFGLLMILKKPPGLEELRNPGLVRYSKGKLIFKGFAINTFNPFTVIFWITWMTDKVITKALPIEQIILFFGGILLMIVISDFGKAYFADAIRSKLLPSHIKGFSWVAGLIIIGFGIYIILGGFGIV